MLILGRELPSTTGFAWAFKSMAARDEFWGQRLFGRILISCCALGIKSPAMG